MVPKKCSKSAQKPLGLDSIIIGVEACTRHGVAVAVGTGSPYAPAELTWGLVLAALRHIPQEVAQMKAGQWQSTIGQNL